MKGGSGERGARLKAMLSKDAYLAALAEEGARLALAGRGDLSAPIAACPGWTVESVVGHVGRVHRLANEQIVRQADGPLGFRDVERPPAGAAVADYLESGLEALLSTLRGLNGDEPTWAWGVDQHARFYFRRMALETAVHRYDAEIAQGSAAAFDSELATDGIAEFYGSVLPHSVARRADFDLPAGSLHVHRADGEGEWMIKADGGKLVVTHEHGKGDAAVRGPASDLFVYVWNRGLPDSLQVFGDEAVARAWQALAP